MPHLDKTDRVLALRRAALEQPEDDAPRLVYADALALAGDPDRAELIAIGCELASSRFRAIERPALPLREAELLEAHAARWTETLTRRGVSEVRFRRGFPSAITIPATAFERHASALLTEEPIEVVHLTGIEELRTKDLAALLDAASGPLARSDGGFTPVRGIGFPGATLDRRRIQTIFAKESVVSAPHMTSLSLARTSWDQAALRSLSWLEPAGATHVDLSHVTCRDVGAPRRAMNANAYVERSCAAEVLTSLLPRASHITTRGDALGVARLFDAIRKKQLVSLEAYVTGADDEILKTSLPRPQTAMRLCAESARSLRELRLRGFGSYEILFPALAEASFLEELTVLDLGERALLYPSSTDDAMHRAFAAMTKLVVLGLRGLELGWRRSIGELIDHPSRVSLRSLTLHDGDALGAIKYLLPPQTSASSPVCSSKHLEGLTHLELGAPSLTSMSPEARLLRHRFGEGLTIRE